jgi:hypothetical protein
MHVIFASFFERQWMEEIIPRKDKCIFIVYSVGYILLNFPSKISFHYLCVKVLIRLIIVENILKVFIMQKMRAAKYFLQND